MHELREVYKKRPPALLSGKNTRLMAKWGFEVSTQPDMMIHNRMAERGW